MQAFFYALIFLIFVIKINMFSQGQMIFALAFVIIFIVTMIVMYRKDLKMHAIYYKGSMWVLLAFLSFIGILFVIKYTLKN